MLHFLHTFFNWQRPFLGRKRVTFFALLATVPLLTPLTAQVTCAPVFPTADDNVTIYYDASQGNAALLGVNPVWAHLGVITNLSSGPSDWKHVATTWGTNNAAAMMTYVSPNLWSKTFNIRTFFNIPMNETVLKMAFVFRNANGSLVGRASDGSDIYYDVSATAGVLQTTFIQPTAASFLKNIGEQIPVNASASLLATLTLYDNGSLVTTTPNAQMLQTTLNVTAPGLHQVDFVATTPTASDTSTFIYIVPGNVIAEDPPSGTELGINYLNNGDVRLELYAPNKSLVHVIGDFNNWQTTDTHLMRRSLDGTTWWIELSGLPANQPVRFQYQVDGALRIADPLSTLVLDPWNDGFIPLFTFPNQPAYPTGKTAGIVSVLQTNQPGYNWQANNYTRPKKTDLVVYELLMRDFVSRHDYPTLLDTLDYLDRLGITAIELMPVNEFDGNINWGYGPAFHKALDKYYGSAEALKTVIDACHQRGIAVILDVVFNQATSASPLAQLYWDSANNRPAANNPWLNPTATHDFSVFNDFNHESLATKAYVKNCVQYWITEFRVDGFRFDLSKGFTQKNTIGNVGAWGAYDASRVAIWKDYANFMWAIDPDFYVILEHFADNSEEKELAEYGMMLWGNMWGSYKDLALGYNTNANLSWVNYKNRNWSVPHVIGFIESHDEDRIGYELKTYGNTQPGYNVKTLPVGMQRIEMLNNLLFTVPGPKMLWQFGEVGYDFPINYCENGTVNNNCRTDPKPIRWDYFNDPYRRHLYDATASLLQLRKQFDVFETSDFQTNISSGQVRSIFLNSTDLNVAVFANAGISGATVGSPAFQHSGFWYEYYTGDTLLVGSGTPTPITLAAGEYRLYLDKVVALPSYVQLPVSPEPVGAVSFFSVQPNPVQDIFWVNLSLLENADIYLEIRDVAGRIVEKKQYDSLNVGENQLELHANNWPTGIYVAIIRDNSGGVLTRKLVR